MQRPGGEEEQQGGGAECGAVEWPSGAEQDHEEEERQATQDLARPQGHPGAEHQGQAHHGRDPGQSGPSPSIGRVR